MSASHATFVFLLVQLSTAAQLSADAAPFSLTSVGGQVDELSISDIGKVFARSDEAHVMSLNEISKTITVPSAMAQLSRLASAQQLQEVSSLMNGGQVSKASLRSQGSAHKKKPGYSGIDGARHMLNDMIFESLSKYDAEIAKCTEFYAKQCALMEIARGAIAASNYVAANSRMLILDSQENINKCEVAIPETKLELSQHLAKCANEHRALNKRLKIVMGDIAIMTMILKMTDCDAKLVQMKKLVMLRCKDDCTKKNHVHFNHQNLEQQLSQLQSPVSLGLVQDSFDDMFDDNAPIESVQLMQVDNDGFQEPMMNKTKFANPPVPRTKVPSNPCKDPYAGAPSAADKRAAKCTIKKSPQCYKLQSRFLAIQGGISDERDKLLEDISNLEEACEAQKKTLETAIENDESLLSASQTKLAAATEKEAGAGESARQTSKENNQYNSDLVTQMKTCSNNYIQFETELCALKKIRGELYKMKGGGHSAFFQDCQVGKWEPEECTRKCARGEQKLTRSVLTHPQGGSKCLPLAAMRSCNNSPCPVDCRLHSWSGWSKCSAKCGGGVTQRLRDVKQAMKYMGKPCGATSQSKACNAAACEKDCDLHKWTRWSACSKDCDGGTKKRQKFVKNPVEGSGSCPDAWGKKRLQYKNCAMQRCKLPKGRKALPCNKTMDIVLLIDQCPKSGKKGFAAEITAAKTLVDSFQGDGVTAKPNFAIITYCGPRTWTGVSKCTGKSKAKVDMEKTCKIKVALHFEEDMKKVTNILSGLSFAPGTKLVSLGLLTAQAELTLGRPKAQSVVVVFTNGAPLSFRKTRLAAHILRKKTRLLWVVTTKFSPLKDIKTWSTRRWQENIVKVKDYKELASPHTVTHIIANICPKGSQKLKVARRKL